MAEISEAKAAKARMLPTRIISVDAFTEPIKSRQNERHKYPDGDFALAGANGAQGQSARPKCRYPASKALTPLLAPKPAPRATLNRYSNSKTVATAEESKSPLLSAISFFSRLAKILADGNATPEFLASASAIRISLSCKTALKPGA